MKKNAFAALLFWAVVGVTRLTAAPLVPNIQIQVDIESAQAIIDLLGRQQVSEVELTRVAQLFGSQQLIRKVSTYATNADEAFFKRTLREIIETGTVSGRDLYDWKTVKANRPTIQRMLTQLTKHQESFGQSIVEMIGTYTPTTLQTSIRACFLVGGGSLGFTLGNDTTFFVALQKIGDDYEGLLYLVAHELYHSVQAVGERQFRKNRPAGNVVAPPTGVANAYELLANLYYEGTATLVGDPTAVTATKPFIKSQQDEYVKNRDRQESNFTLFEALLFQAYADSAAHAGKLYGVAFSTAFDETGYHVGYEMAKDMERYEGKAAVAQFVGRSPVEFAVHYVRLCQAHPDDRALHRFSKTTEAIIDRVSGWKDKL